MIANELKEYPNIEFRRKEVGLSFQEQFVKSDYLEKQDRVENIQQELRQELQQELQKLQQESQQELKKPTLYSEVLRCLTISALSRLDISIGLGQKKVIREIVLGRGLFILCLFCQQHKDSPFLFCVQNKNKILLFYTQNKTPSYPEAVRS